MFNAQLLQNMEILETRIESNSDGVFNYGKFYFPQLKKGQGITLANSLRRVLLYDLPGFGITHARFKQHLNTELTPEQEQVRQTNVKTNSVELQNIHEFSSIPGMRESIFEFLLNLRSIVFCKGSKNGCGTNSFSPEDILTFSFNKVKDSSIGSSDIFVVRAKDLIQGTISSTGLTLRELNLDIVNPDQYLATIMSKQCPNFEMQFILNATLSKSGFWLPTDGNFFPVKRVNYSVEENSSSTESVFLEIWTNGAIKPEEACQTGFTILIELLQKAQQNQGFQSPSNLF